MLVEVEHKTLGNTLPDVITEPLTNTLVWHASRGEGRNTKRHTG